MSMDVILTIIVLCVTIFWLTSLAFAAEASDRARRNRWAKGYFVAFIIVSFLIGIVLMSPCPPMRLTFRYQKEIYVWLKVVFVLATWLLAFLGAQHLIARKQQKEERILLFEYDDTLLSYIRHFGVPQVFREQIQHIKHLRDKVKDWMDQGDSHWNELD